jgi:Ser/Thr protein kinase RdoA (MazF antagonist)
MTFVDGVALDKVDSPARARSAGALVARWHRCLEGFEYEYAHVRAGVHDTRRHLSVLREALVEHAEHRLHEDVSRLAEPLFRAAESLSLPTPATPAKGPVIHAHGDLKLSNLLFDAHTGAGVCLVDLDTVGRMPWSFEVGDALRSWCNPRGEDVTEATVDRDVFAEALGGYRAEAPSFLAEISAAELATDGLATIALELAARFLGDALNERYFGFDRSRYATRGEHNLVRGRGQWSLARDAIAHRDELVAIAARALR